MLAEYSYLDPIYFQYANDVISGAELTNEDVRLACQRYLDWFDRTDLYFDAAKVEKKIKFIEKMKHWQGPMAGQYFRLLPWQHWVFCNIFGWYYRGTDKRVTRNAFIFIARKNGKTAFASALGLAAMCKDDEEGAEVDLVANNRKQANIAYDDCVHYSNTLDPRGRHLKVLRDGIFYKKTNSKLQVLASDAMGNDGYNASCFILDEFHAMKDWKLYNVMKTSQGARKNPLAIVITTAGYLQSGYPCYDMRIACKEILRGYKTNDGQFSAIYDLEEGDDWTDQTIWKKANPSLDAALQRDTVQDMVNEALTVPSEMYDTLTKQFNMFMSNKDAWIKDIYLNKVLQKVDLGDFVGETTYMGLDLSSVSDLSSWCIMFPPNEHREKWPDKFVFKVFNYIPNIAMESQNGSIYRDFINHGYAKLTSGNRIDYDTILADQQEMTKDLFLYKVCYDEYNATQYAQNAQAVGLPLEPFAQGLGNFNRPTKGLEILILGEQCIIDDNACFKWCMNNAELKEDYNANVKPIKICDDKNKKIDPVIAMIQALGGYLLEQRFTGSFAI